MDYGSGKSPMNERVNLKSDRDPPFYYLYSDSDIIDERDPGWKNLLIRIPNILLFSVLFYHLSNLCKGRTQGNTVYR